jgi:hypothetical protein
MKLKLPLAFLFLFNFATAQVPSDWSATSTYSSGALVISNGTTYISQQDVNTAGTALTDTSYWLSLDAAAPSSAPTTSAPTTPPDASTVPTTPPETDTTGDTGDSDSRLINLSTRSFVGPKSQFQEMVGGFGITGTGSVKLFVRGYGPHLATFFGDAALSDPMVTIKTFPGEEEVLVNKQWNPSDAEWAEISDEYQPSQSGDCAAFITLQPGLYTTEVIGENETSGIGMIEIFTYDDLTAKSGGTVGNGTASLSKLMNLSTRSYIGLKDQFQEMVGGFGVSGTDPLKLFIRSYGPHLATFFGDAALSDPIVSIKTFPGGEVSLENDNWSSSDAEWAEVSDEYKPSTAGDSGAFITVQPGLFTTEVLGVNNAVGLGMIEIFTYDELNKK